MSNIRDGDGYDGVGSCTVLTRHAAAFRLWFWSILAAGSLSEAEIRYIWFSIGHET